MASDGKHLEALVAFVEKTLLPDGFDVKTNERVFNDEGAQIAEFDIEIRGRIGSADFAWLIECRDRPAEGPAPGSWVEQLYGRRVRFGFNKVTAVSTTGFAAGAIDFARKGDIELREVRSLNPDEFAGWLLIRHIVNTVRHTSLLNATLIVDERESEERKQAVLAALGRENADTSLLKASSTGQCVPVRNAFHAAVEQAGCLFDGLELNGPPKTVKLRVEYTNDDDHFVVETPVGEIRIRTIVYHGELRRKKILIPLSGTTEYRNSETRKPISQAAVFAPQSIMGMKFATEMHHMADSGETHVILRYLQDDA
jgi:hypothetical protein